MSDAAPQQTHLRKTDPRGYIQRGRETFSQEARQMLFRFMIDSREEINEVEGPRGSAPQTPQRSTAALPIIEAPEYLAGYRKLEAAPPKVAEGYRFEH